MNVITAAFQTAAALAEARADLAHLSVSQAEADYRLALSKAIAEDTVIIAAGGDKALGPNEDARRRALTIALEQDALYQMARRRAETYDLDVRMSRLEVEHQQDHLAIILAALGAGITDISDADFYSSLPSVPSVASPVQERSL